MTVCNLCRYNPPSSSDGKPCTMCPASTNTEVKVVPIEVLQEIRKKICDFRELKCKSSDILDLIDKYKAESEDKE